jgi:pyruvate/2-oxoglutarate/acetoin dehydrogenase E1 component
MQIGGTVRYVESLNAGLHQLMAEDERVVVLGEDILDPYGGAFKVTRGLSSKWPGRVLGTPISEASIVGFAAGLALSGLRPVAEIMFGDFLALCMDQFVNGASKYSWMYNGQASAPFVLRAPMGGRRGYGPTHSQTLETLLMSVPGVEIVAPSQFHDSGNLLKTAVQGAAGPVLFVEGKLLYPKPLELPAGGRCGDFFCTELRHHAAGFPTVSLTLVPDLPPQATLVAYGAMASVAAEAATSVFLRDEIVVEVLVPSLVKPCPAADVIPSVERSGAAIIAEEGMRSWGWGAELACQLHESCHRRLSGPVQRAGAKSFPIPSARQLEDCILPQTADVVRAIRQAVAVN